MKILDKVWVSLGLFEEQNESEDDSVKTDENDIKNRKKTSLGNNVVNLSTAQKQQIKVMVVEPFSFDDAQHVADHLKNRKPVVVNFENTEKEVAKRMVDFISGTTYALNGTIQKVGQDIFLCAPNNVDVAYTPREEVEDRVFMPWNNK